MTPNALDLASRAASAVAFARRTVTTLAVAVAPLLLRIALALPFFRSGLTRWDAPFELAPATLYLFTSLFQLHIGGAAYPLPFPETTAYITGVCEIVLPILLILGLGTRYAALGILAMTIVIQLVAPEGWANFHLAWGSMAVAVIAFGAGPVSLDHAIRRLLPAGARA